MSLVYVFAASESEAKPVVQIAESSSKGSSVSGAKRLRSGTNEFVLVVGGIGPRAARARAVEALGSSPISDGSAGGPGRKPDAVLVIGLCGALSSSLPETQIVAYTECLCTEESRPALRCSPPITHRLIELLKSRGIACDPVTGITSPRVALTKEDRVALGRSGASVVDMESYEILAVAAEAGVSGLVLRVVSDSLDREMPDFNRALMPDGTANRRRLARVILGSPLRMARLLVISKRAMGHFAKALEIILPADCFALETPAIGK